MAPRQERERKALGWLGNQVAGVAVGYILGGTLSSILSVFVTFFVFLKAGLLRLSQWPGAAFIVLAIGVSVLSVVVFGFAIVYTFRFVMHSWGDALAMLLGGKPPKRSWLLVPLDWLAVAVLIGVDKVTEWNADRKVRHTKSNPRNEESSGGPS